MVRRVAAVLVAVVGLFWLISTLVLNYPEKTQAVDDVTNAFRPVYSDAGIAQQSKDLEVTTAFATDFQTKAVPALAARLGVTPTQFQQQLGTQYPAVGVGIQTLPAALPYFQKLLDGVKADQADFKKVDDTPTSGLPNTSVHWIFVGLGVVSILLGAGALLRGGVGGIALLLAGVLGLATIIATLVISVPAKTAAADRINDNVRPIFQPANAQLARSYVTKLKALDTQLRGQALPGVAQQLNVSPALLQLSLGAQLPAVATGLQQLPAILDRLDVLVTKIEDNIDNKRLVDELPTKDLATVWVTYQLLVPAAVLVVAGATFFVGSGRRREDEDEDAAVA
jgi:hypothetical protein